MPATIAALGSWLNGHKIDNSRNELVAGQARNLAATGQVHREVKTLNGQTLAQLADAGESRRIDTIAEADRTALQEHHQEATKGEEV